jgi:hypothetical protein
MKTVLTILSAGALALVTSCDWDNSDSDRKSLKTLHNACSTIDLTYEGDKILTVTQSFGARVAEVKNFFYIHGQLTAVKMTSDYGSSSEIKLLYDAGGKLKREIDNEYFDGLDFGKNPMKYAYVRVTDFLYDGAGNIATVLITQTNKDDSNTSNTGRESDDELSKNKAMERYDYTWSKGNVVKEVRRSCEESGECQFYTTETSYAYDNKRNFTNQQLAFKYIYYTVPFVFSRNNVSKISSDFNGQPTLSSWFEFRYNKNGYPSELSAMSEGSTPNPSKLEYR